MRPTRVGVATSLLVLVTGANLLTSPAGPAVATAVPALYTCGGHAQYRPHHFQLACGDGNAYFDRASWRNWGATAAAGSARQWYNTCKPSCSDGNYIKHRVTVRLYRPQTLYGHRYFSRIFVGGPHGYRASTPRPHRH